MGVLWRMGWAEQVMGRREARTNNLTGVAFRVTLLLFYSFIGVPVISILLIQPDAFFPIILFSFHIFLPSRGLGFVKGWG